MKAKQVNEALGIKGSKFYTHDINGFDKAWAGPEGMLGNNGVFIPWKFVDEMIAKYRGK